jgi:hypothetical protein
VFYYCLIQDVVRYDNFGNGNYLILPWGNCIMVKYHKTTRSTYMLWSSIDCGQSESIRYLNMNSSRLYVTEFIVWVTENKTGVSRTNDWCDINIMESFITLCWIHLSIFITTCQQQWMVTSQWTVDADFWKWEGVRKDKSRGTSIIGGGGSDITKTLWNIKCAFFLTFIKLVCRKLGLRSYCSGIWLCVDK